MKKHVLFWIAIKSSDPHLKEKHGDFKYLDISRLSWEWWCKKNDVVFFPYEVTGHEDTNKHKATWQRWFDVFDQVEAAGIDYDKIALIDGSTIVRWDCPNFFDMTDDRLTAFRSLENLRWITESADGYKDLFGGFDFDLKKYVSCGFQIFNSSHKEFLQKLKEFYFERYDDIMKLQNEKVRRGTDQPVYNYMLQVNNIEVNTSLPPSLMLNHLYRFDWFSHNWQLNVDQTPFFLKYGHIYFYSGFPNRGDRFKLMSDTWNAIKGFYQ